jgi:hypothetical protein
LNICQQEYRVHCCDTTNQRDGACPEESEGARRGRVFRGLGARVAARVSRPQADGTTRQALRGSGNPASDRRC